RRAVLRIASLAGDPRTILAAAVGAGVALVPLAAWFAQTRGAGHYFFAMWENTIVLGFALTEAVKLVLAYAVIGSLVGLWVAFSFRTSETVAGRSSKSTFLMALVAGWAVLIGLSGL